MPLYEYRCTSCGYSFEKIQSFKSEPETVCPKCQGVLVRPVTAPALRFEGAGWYVNDYAGKGGAKAGDPAAAKSAEAGVSEAAGARGEGKSDPGTDSKSASKPESGSGGSAAESKTAPAAAPAATTASSTGKPGS